MSKAAPRIEVVDALRSFALMALFLIHMVGYFGLDMVTFRKLIGFTVVEETSVIILQIN